MGYELVIKGGLVVDGSGELPREADVAVNIHRVVAIGPNLSAAGAGRVIDARGLVVAPGFVDVHTHYDAQVCWDPLLTCSSWHGVTTAVLGNCGFAIAPCHRQDRGVAMRTLVHVEGMSLKAMEAGIRWEFETFPEYLDAVQRFGVGINVAAFLGHSALRLYAMGADAADRAATAREIQVMKKLVREAMTAGAIGFASSTAEPHVGDGGKPVPSRLAEFEELLALVTAMGESRRGVFMMTVGTRTSVDHLKRLARESGRPVVWAALFHQNDKPERTWRALAWTDEAAAEGLTVRPQISCRPLVMDFTLRNPYPFEGLPSWQQVLPRPESEWKHIYSSRTFRQALKADLTPPGKQRLFHGRWEEVRVVNTRRPEHRPLEGKSVAEIASLWGKEPVDAFLDLGVAEELDTEYTVALMNTDDEALARMLRHPHALVSLSDAGAHQTLLCDAGYSSTLLGKWVREKKVLPLEEAVRRLTSEPADLYGIPNRGRVAPGYFADLVLFDPARLRALPPEKVYDMPASEPRFISRCEGMQAVLVNGTVLLEDGQPAVSGGRWPGRLLRRFDG
ncbi:MAG TPA: amidohydrolase family protein [Methylomirabilota bacterium]|nr:amidohydrolase family protein [Methylomirabilota bacterium]